MGLQEEGENDMVRSLLADTNPYLLALTATVSLLHTLFEMLAFRSDVKFWRQRASKSVEGLSVRSVALNCFFQTVIFLYLCDNDTSWMVLGTSGVGLLIEYWKISKVIKFELPAALPAGFNPLAVVRALVASVC